MKKFVLYCLVAVGLFLLAKWALGEMQEWYRGMLDNIFTIQ